MTATAIRPAAAGRKAHAALRASGGIARVIARLAESLYLEAGGEILWLGGRRGLRHPRAVLAGDLPRDGAPLTFDLDGLEPWPARRVRDAGGTALRAGARDLRERLARCARPGRPAGLGRLIVGALLEFPLDRAARPATELALACDRDDAWRAVAAADSLLGLGPGLTPSGDDFVGGVLFARCALGPSAAWARARSEVIARARARTHPISAALLGDLAAGEGPEPLHDLIDALARREAGAAWAAVERLDHLGSSSGWDLLAGVLVGLVGTAALPPRRCRALPTCSTVEGTFCPGGTALDPHRLPRTVVPTRYDLRLAPDLTAFTFDGEETVAVTVTEPVSEIWLNAVELTISEATIARDGGPALRATIAPDEAHERCALRFAETIAPGAWRLHLAFRGTLNDKLRGFYRSTYKDSSGTTRTLAATQFEATDARRAFPCWDEPAFKAVFAATLAIDPALTAVSNTAIASERLEDGRKIVAFADTIKMSTYLVAFIVGELEATDPVMVGRTPLRVWCVPGKRRLAAFGREIGAASLAFLADYYGLPYPGDKLDLLAIPDFAAGAMENLGAITFRETALLVDETAATHSELERIADVVAHENAHMWFGDLVTMDWWNGIWLNEAFATFLEMVAVDAWRPEWQRWTTFGVSRSAAFAVDGLHSTRPIEFPVGAPREADAMFDVLTYEKGASVLRMLEQYLGPDVFRAGVREYLRRHAYDNAATGDLWAALGRAAGQAIPELMDGWIFHPGFPIVSARVEGGQLVLAQQRFAYLPAPLESVPGRGAAPAVDPDQRWQVPLQIRIEAGGASRVERVLLKERETRIPLTAAPDAVVVVNEGGHGFYRVRYSRDLLDRLVRRLPAGLAPIERFNLLGDAWAAAVAGLIPIEEYLDLTAEFRGERDKNVWVILTGSLHALNRIISPGDRPGLERLVRDRVAGAVEELGWAPRADDDELRRQLRGDLIRTLGTLGGDAAAQARAAELYASHRAGTAAVDPNVLPALIAILAHAGDAARYGEFAEAFRTAATPQEEQRYLYALAAFRPRGLVEQTLARTISGEIRTQDAPFVARSMLMAPHSREIAWDFVRANWDTMDRLYPKQGLRRMAEGVIGLATPELEQSVHAFFAERKIDLGGKTLEQYLEQLRIAVTLRAREGGRLSAYLARR